jgi:hypothetical protein
VALDDSPSLTHSTWLTTFPLSFAHRETLPLPSEGWRTTGIGTPARVSTVWKFFWRRTGTVDDSLSLGQGKARGRGGG